MRKLLLTAMQSGQGKTVTTMALLAALKKKGLEVTSYKVGPDYIDPSLHERILKKKSYNLDSFFLEESEIKELFSRTAKGDVAVIEGVMGYYDGLGGTSTGASSWEISQFLDATSILVVQPKGSSLSLAAQIKGIMDFRPNSLKGILLSKCSASLYDFLKPLIEKETGLELLGYLPDTAFLQSLDELYDASEDTFLDHMDELAELTLSHVNLERLLELAKKEEPELRERAQEQKEKIRLAYTKDEAFAFIYHENLRVLEEAGFELVPFSPLRDEFPTDCCGLYLCGGYQESYLKELSENKTLLYAIKEKMEKGMPTLCEGAGFVYLHEKVEDKKGEQHQLVGAFSGMCRQEQRLQQFGYVELRAKEDGFFLKKDEVLKGHFYHRWTCPDGGMDLVATRPISGKRTDVLHQKENFFGGMIYLYLPSEKKTLENFYNACKKWRYAWVEN